MNRHRFQTLEEEERYHYRLIALSLQHQRETGLANHPYLVKLFESIKQRISDEGIPQNKSSSEKTLSTEEVKKNLFVVITKQEFVFAAIASLQKSDSWDIRGGYTQENIQIIAQETYALILHLSPIFKKDSDGEKAVERLKVVRSYLLKKFTDVHFLSPHGLRAEQPQVFHQEQRRVYKYFGELQAVINELVEIVKHLEPPQQHHS